MLHDIYLQDRPTQQDTTYDESTATESESRTKPVNTYPYIVDYLSATESSKLKTRSFCNSKNVKGILPFSGVPKVGFVHEEHIRKVAERRKKCFSAPMRGKRYSRHDNILNEFSLRPLKLEEISMPNGVLHLEDVEGSVCGGEFFLLFMN